MFRQRDLLAALLGLVTNLASAEALPSPVRCDLNAPEWEQALCLLTQVKTYGILETRRVSLPEPWKKIFLHHQQVLPTATKFRAYSIFQFRYEPEGELGGMALGCGLIG